MFGLVIATGGMTGNISSSSESMREKDGALSLVETCFGFDVSLGLIYEVMEAWDFILEASHLSFSPSCRVLAPLLGSMVRRGWTTPTGGPASGTRGREPEAEPEAEAEAEPAAEAKAEPEAKTEAEAEAEAEAEMEAEPDARIKRYRGRFLGGYYGGYKGQYGGSKKSLLQQLLKI